MADRQLLILSLALVVASWPSAGHASEASSPAKTTAPADTLLILDASGSMWGQIDGKTKIEIARDSVSALLADWPENHQLGLMAYGHREEGNCEDIEVLTPVAPVEPTTVQQRLAAVNPKGKTPLSAAVQQAADLLAYGERPATVILLSDGLENCGMDPCKLAAQLEAQGIDFTAHVIGFDVGEDTAGLRCLAEATGGRYSGADDAASLNQAMETVVAATRAETIELIARLEDGGEIVTKGVSWRITEPEADFDGRYKTLQQTGAPRGRLALENGRYRIVARRGDTRVPKLVTVDDSTETIEVILGAGDLKLAAVLGTKDDTTILDKTVNWRITELTADFDGRYKSLAQTGNPRPTFSLPAGEYRAVARRGDATVSLPVVVEGGAVSTYTVPLNAADLRAEVRLGDGELLKKGLAWRIEAAEPNLDGKYEPVARSGGVRPKFTVPAGSYRLVIKRGAATLIKPITLEAGEQAEESLELQAGEVALTTMLTKGSEPIKRNVSWHVYEGHEAVDGKKSISSTGAAEGRFTLNEGRYRILVKRQEAKQSIAVEVTAGSQQRMSVPLEAAEVRAVALAPDGAALRKRLLWRVYQAPFSERQNAFASRGSADARFTLPAGNYRIVVKHGDDTKTLEESFSAGEQRRIEVQF